MVRIVGLVTQDIVSALTVTLVSKTGNPYHFSKSLLFGGFFLAKNTIYIYCASRSEYERPTYLIYGVSYPST